MWAVRVSMEWGSHHLAPVMAVPGGSREFTEQNLKWEIKLFGGP